MFEGVKPGGGYRVSSWVEKTAYANADAVIAVSAAMIKFAETRGWVSDVKWPKRERIQAKLAQPTTMGS